MFYFVRHGKTDYSKRNTGIYQGFGVNLAPLSEKGIQQISEAAKDPCLQGADLILCSPYTRAVQSAAILSQKLGADIVVETDLHEWVADTDYNVVSDEEEDIAYEAYLNSSGRHSSEADHWEETETLRKRILNVLRKYESYPKVVVVGHETMIRAVTGCGHIKCGTIIEYPQTI
ncbi:MAG: histidine phosphatase family protein [Erysipelotrichaceae bacterium]|nr:histidine phosphatase family protein [Erysipelotrichaceae bacterium]